MSAYDAYVETSAEGLCMAHVPALPGCFARGQSKEAALRRLLEVIAGYHAWLARHGEAATEGLPPGFEQIELRIVSESEAGGPFNPGDTAALFAPDRQPPAPAEFESYLRLMGYARSDLLALTRPLPSALLDWQPFPEWFTIRQVLRHVGNAEEWYVSRLVPPESLPPEWENDEDLRLFDFLEMERCTAVARLRQLTPEERTSVCYPTAWTRHPEEPWTLRKVLRRFLEHELEHTAQVRQVVDLYRRGLLASLAAEEAVLLELLLGLDEQTLAEEGLDLVLADLAAEREALGSWLAGVPEEDLFAAGRTSGVLDAAARWSQRLREQGARLAAWREGLSEKTEELPSAPVLKAALAAARRELLAAVALVPAGERHIRLVCGTWSVQDVIGHIADWEVFGVEGLRHMASGAGTGPVPVEYISDVDAWNKAHVAARREQSWSQVWADLAQAREDLDAVLRDMETAALSRRHRFPWNTKGTAYDWLCVYLRHDHEHAAGLRAVLTLPEIYSSP